MDIKRHANNLTIGTLFAGLFVGFLLFVFDCYTFVALVNRRCPPVAHPVKGICYLV